ncbi:MAG TPA: preprotein translocase subunit SecG [Candidatus Rubrimentiphilum sp.]|nr:preprotein translocase subunit SecG [Candidatus Rubrimentiphilum sp.]
MISLTLLAAAAKPAAGTLRVPANAVPTGAPLQVNPAAAPVATPQTLTWFQVHAPWLTHGLAGLFVLVAIALITLLAVQTTKQEGLSGTIGGRVESAYSRLGAEEQLKRITGVFAVMFVVIGTILSLTGI